jgi:hypothetical protein
MSLALNASSVLIESTEVVPTTWPGLLRTKGDLEV